MLFLAAGFVGILNAFSVAFNPSADYPVAVASFIGGIIVAVIGLRIGAGA